MRVTSRALVLVAAIANTVVALGAQQTTPAPPLLTLTQVVRIDANRENLVNFSQIRIGPRGSMLINQSDDGFLLLFDSTGKRLKQIGRKGEGPGEFGSTGDFGWIRDTIWIFDDQRARITIMSEAGRYVRSFNFAQIPASVAHRTPPLRPFAVHAYGTDNTLLFSAERSIESEAAQGGQPFSPSYAIAGEAANLIRVVAPLQSPPAFQVRLAGGRMSSFCSPAIGSPGLQSVSGDGRRIAFVETRYNNGVNGTFRLVVLGSGADTIVSRSHPFTAERIPARLLDSMVVARASRIPDMAVRAQCEKFSRENSPPGYPPFRELMVGQDNTYWILVRSNDGNRHWLVLDESGNTTGRVVLKSNQTLRAATRTALWISESDADGLRDVVRLGVSR